MNAPHRGSLTHRCDPILNEAAESRGRPFILMDVNCARHRMFAAPAEPRKPPTGLTNRRADARNDLDDDGARGLNGPSVHSA